MVTTVFAGAEVVAFRRPSTTWHRWVNDLRTTAATQLVEANVPADGAVATVTRLLTLVQSARQLVYQRTFSRQTKVRPYLPKHFVYLFLSKSVPKSKFNIQQNMTVL